MDVETRCCEVRGVRTINIIQKNTSVEKQPEIYRFQTFPDSSESFTVFSHIPPFGENLQSKCVMGYTETAIHYSLNLSSKVPPKSSTGTGPIIRNLENKKL